MSSLLAPTTTEELARTLMKDVQEIVLENAPDNLDQDNLAAWVAYEAIRLLEERRQTLSNQAQTAQAWFTIQMSRKQGWLYLVTPEHPNGFGSLDEMLRAAGVHPSTRSQLNALGSYVLPYCDTHSIDIEQYLAENVFGRLVPAIPALRANIEEVEVWTDGGTEWVLRDDAQGRKRTGLRRAAEDASHLDDVKAILTDVEVATSRKTIRKKYQKKRKDALGVGGWMRVEEKAVMVLVLDDPEDVSTINARLNDRVKWELVAAGRENGRGSIRIDVDF